MYLSAYKVLITGKRLKSHLFQDAIMARFVPSIPIDDEGQDKGNVGDDAWIFKSWTVMQIGLLSVIWHFLWFSFGWDSRFFLHFPCVWTWWSQIKWMPKYPAYIFRLINDYSQIGFRRSRKIMHCQQWGQTINDSVSPMMYRHSIFYCPLSCKGSFHNTTMWL